jgi:hypothetical protein
MPKASSPTTPFQSTTNGLHPNVLKRNQVTLPHSLPRPISFTLARHVTNAVEGNWCVDWAFSLSLSFLIYLQEMVKEQAISAPFIP